MSTSTVNLSMSQLPSLGLEPEDFATQAEAQSQYAGGYQPFNCSGPQAFQGDFDAFNDHLASVGDEPVGHPDTYWTQLVQIKNLELRDQDLLEKQDKKHRMGDLLEQCLKLYERKKGAAGNKGFYEWLDAIPEWDRTVMIRDALALFGANSAQQAARPDQLNLKPSMVKAFLYGVRYLDRAGRRQYRLTFSGGLAKYEGKPFDTRNMRTVFSGPGCAIWVQSPKDHFYAGNHVTGQFHHSSFLSGNAVKCGGEIVASNGVIKLISAKSGHYQPSKTHFANAIKTLGQSGVNLNSLMVVVWVDKFSAPTMIAATDFLKNPNVWETWGNGKIALKL